MNRLHLDYQGNTKTFPWAGVAVLVLSLTAVALTGNYYQGLSQRVDYWEANNGQPEKASARQALSQREMSEMALEIRHANEVLDQITLPWDQLFQAVEWSSGKEVSLLTMEPDAEKHEVKISGEAKNIASVLRYVKHLTTQEIFSSVYLQSHQVQQQNPDKPVRFALVAAWKVAP